MTRRMSFDAPRRHPTDAEVEAMRVHVQEIHAIDAALESGELDPMNPNEWLTREGFDLVPGRAKVRRRALIRRDHRGRQC